MKPLLQGLLGAKEEKMPGGTMKYDGSLDGTSVKVRVDYAARDVQLIYSVSISDPERKVVVIGSDYEHFFGISGWDYLTEANAEGVAGVTVSRNGAAERSRTASVGPADVRALNE